MTGEPAVAKCNGLMWGPVVVCHKPQLPRMRSQCVEP